ncbi:MAG TPA: hypothetical protein VL334_07935, partial [Anaerolineae bacterium]|nr:hypothetical protein [Anaerolineae bacterium]
GLAHPAWWELIFVGLTGMIDPPRLEVKPAIAITAAALAVFRIGLSWFPDNIYYIQMVKSGF